MPESVVTHLRAVIADDRADVRALVVRKLGEIGLTQVEAVPASIGGQLVLAILGGGSSQGAADPDPAQPLSPTDLLTRFTHDVASPLTGVLAFSELLTKELAAGSRAQEDVARIHAGALEIASLVRELSVRIAGRRPD